MQRCARNWTNNLKGLTMAPPKSPHSVRHQATRIVFESSKPLRALAVAHALDRSPKLVGSLLVVSYQCGDLSRMTLPGTNMFGYFMTAEQKDQFRLLDRGVRVKRYTFKMEPIDISARLIFLRKLADNPFWQEHVELHNIIADYQRAAALASPEDADEPEALDEAA